MTTIEQVRTAAGGPRRQAEVRIGLALDPPAQRRWTILLRGVLALPIQIGLAVLGFVAFFVAIAAWFEALVTGRVSDSLQRFLTKWLRASVGVSAYANLLTPAWPGLPFDGGDEAQTSLVIDHVRLRRSAVLFRFLLAVPAFLVEEVVAFGLAPFIVVMWFVGIVRGRVPRALHQATAVIMRFQIRVLAFAYLASPTQPFRGLLGDGPDDDPATPGMPADPWAAPPATWGMPADPWAAPPATPDMPADPWGPPPPPVRLPTRWPITRGARAIVVSTFVIGTVLLVAYGFLLAGIVGSATRVVDRTSVQVSYDATLQTLSTFGTDASKCATSDCIASAARTARDRESQIVIDLVSSYRPVASTTSAFNAYTRTLTDLTTELAEVGSSADFATIVNILDTRYTTTAKELAPRVDALTRALGGSAVVT